MHKFTCRCPAHEDRSPSLSVSEGIDGRVLIYCHAGCEAARVIRVLNLQWADLFRDGHRQARRVRAPRQEPAGNAGLVADLLAALDRAGQPWRVMVATRCVYCDHPAAWTHFRSDGPPDFDCPDGCSATEFTQALAGRVLLAQTRRAA
jgi:hypothetical protein